MTRRQRVRPGWNDPAPWWYVIAEFAVLLLILAVPLVIGMLASVCEGCR